MRTKKPTINIIGAGRLGLQLAIAFKKHATINAITVRQHSKIDKLKSLSCAKQVQIFGAQLPPADITFITTPDDSLANVAAELTKLATYTKGAVISHCSGLLTSEVLNPLKNLGYATGSIHPFRAFSHFEIDKKYPLLKNCPCFIEGDPFMCSIVGELFKKCGAFVHHINPKYKTNNHLAAVIASNHLITLLVHAQECLHANGLSDKENLKILINLMYSTLQNIEHSQSTQNSLTGPIVRGDQKTLEKHFAIIESPMLKKMYSTLSLAAIEIALLDDKTNAKLKNIIFKQR